MNFYKDLFPHVAGVGVGIFLLYVFDIIFDKIRKRWILVEIFANPETGTCYEIKERNGKFRFYINGIRVPQKIYHWL